MTIKEYFETLKTKDIICWGSGRYYRNRTAPFLSKSGLIKNLKGFVDVSCPKGSLTDERIGKEKLSMMDKDNTVILIAVTGYDEIIDQIRMDKKLSVFEAIPSIYLESLYEDMLIMSADKPPLNYRKHDKEMIPRIIHALWFSGEEMPDLYKRCLESWKKFCPDYEIKIWDLKSYKPDDCLFFEQALADKNWAFASDYARADLLYRYGGIYMDLDVEMLKPIDDLLYNDAYMSFESMDRIECGSGMGARACHPIMKEICDSYKKRPYLRSDGSWDNSTCPVRYTKVIEKHGLKKNGGFQTVDDITIYPFEVLTGKSFDTGIVYTTDLSYTLHHHNGSWIPDGAYNAMSVRYDKIDEFLRSKGITV